MNRDLLIVGTGGSSREIVEAIEESNLVQEPWNLLGFLDDDLSLTHQSFYGYPVLGTTSAISHFPNAHVLIGVANDRNLFVRRDIVNRLSIDTDRFATFVHPTAWVSKRATIGFGTAILQFSFVSGNVLIGNHAIISQAVQIGHDATVGSYVSISTGISIAGAARVGDGVYIGSGARILPRMKIGAGSLVGAGAVVVNSVPSGVTVFGNPARVLPVGKRRERRFSGNREG
jgi:sugar O-acyltransferase (sialic acid O-acetyltransferase NeuD family)